MPLTLPPLPYALNALEPHLSERTLQFHYGKHHQTYLNNLNALIQNSEWESLSLEEIMHLSYQKTENTTLFNNASQVWNHSFYWKCMKQGGGGMPSPSLLKALEEAFGSFDAFKEQFKQAALSQFGSGWAWLVAPAQGALALQKTSNADTPLVRGDRPLLTVDVWEHAYYLEYQNRRADYVDIFLNHLVNWDFVESCRTGSGA